MWLRRLGAIYGLAFLFLASASEHHHLNALEDLVSDGPSDSGTIIERLGHSNDCQSGIHAVRLVDDDPCLSCFHSDHACAAAAAAIFVLREVFTPLEPRHAFLFPTSLEAPGRPPSSRSPPLRA